MDLLQKVQLFNQSIHHDFEIIHHHQKKFEVRVLYLGLTSAYFLSKDEQLSGYGSSTTNGWQWEIKPELKFNIQKAFHHYDHPHEAKTFINLPVEAASK